MFEQGADIDGVAPVVLVTWPDYPVADEDCGALLTRARLDVRLRPRLGARSPEQLLEMAHDVVAAIVSVDPFDEHVLERCRNLRVIARTGVGIDAIDVEAATRLGIAVTVTPGANEASVADHTLAMILALNRRLVEHDSGVRHGEWNRTGKHTPTTLTGSTVGLVGYGRIGRLVGDRLAGFGVRLVAYDPFPHRDGRAEHVGLDELLSVSDVVSLHVPLIPGTAALIGERELALMRGDAVIVNTSRGAVVDEAALVAALRNGVIGGAAIDVFANEPPTGSDLLALPNVLLSPHIAGLSTASVEEMTQRATASVLDVLGGRVPADLANPAVVGTMRPPLFAHQKREAS